MTVDPYTINFQIILVEGTFRKGKENQISPLCTIILVEDIFGRGKVTKSIPLEPYSNRYSIPFLLH